jgi:hypothetical protein
VEKRILNEEWCSHETLNGKENIVPDCAGAVELEKESETIQQ